MKYLGLALLAFTFVGCQKEWVLYGVESDIRSMQEEAIGVSDGVAQKTGPVTVSGEIGEVCEVGCWFYLIDEEDLLFVRRDLSLSFVIPRDSTGRKAVVMGSLEGEGEALELVAQTVGILE